MKEHDFSLEWPPIEVPVLVKGLFWDRNPMQSHISPLSPKRKFIIIVLYWIVENGEIIWKDPFNKVQFYLDEKYKWWSLDEDF